MTVDPASVIVAARRRAELTVMLILDAIAFVLAVAALSGGLVRALAAVVGTVVTGVAIQLSRQSWAGARSVWMGETDPSRLRGLVKRSLWPSVPVLLASLAVAVGIGVPSLTRIFGSSPTGGNATWADGVLLGSLLLYLFASAGAARYSLSLRR